RVVAQGPEGQQHRDEEDQEVEAGEQHRGGWGGSSYRGPAGEARNRRERAGGDARRPADIPLRSRATRQGLRRRSAEAGSEAQRARLSRSSGSSPRRTCSSSATLSSPQNNSSSTIIVGTPNTPAATA